MKTLNRKLAVLLFTLILAISSAFPALAAGSTPVAGASFATYTSIPSAFTQMAGTPLCFYDGTPDSVKESVEKAFNLNYSPSCGEGG